MKCKGCEFKKQKKENPGGVFPRWIVPHTCNQPDSSKREDLPKWAARAIMMPDGLCHFEDGTIVDSKQPIEEGCGTRNTMET